MRSSAEWVESATGILQERYDRLRRASGNTLAPTFPIEPEFDADEAAHFVKGIESGLFSIDDDGYVQSVVLPASRRGSEQKRILSLFWPLLWSPLLV
jgi:hypothetical protein